MKRIETSKLVLGAVLVFCMVMAVAVLAGWFLGLDGAPEMLGVAAGVAGTVIGFYSWKAKGENLIKLSKDKIDKNLIKMISKVQEDEEA